MKREMRLREGNVEVDLGGKREKEGSNYWQAARSRSTR